MRKPALSGGFWLSFGLNLVLNFEGAALFALLLIGHFALSVPLWIPLVVLALWIGSIFLTTLILYFIPSGSGSSGNAAATTHYSSSGKYAPQKDGNQNEKEGK